MISDLFYRITGGHLGKPLPQRRERSSSEERTEEFVLKQLLSPVISGSSPSPITYSLHEAVERGSIKKVREILEETNKPDISDENGETPLFLTVRALLPQRITDFEDLEQIKELVFVLTRQGEFEPKLPSKNLNAHQQITLLLLHYGADPNHINHAGLSALDLCFQWDETQAAFPIASFFKTLREQSSALT